MPAGLSVNRRAFSNRRRRQRFRRSVSRRFATSAARSLTTMKKIVLTAAMLFAATGAEAADLNRAPGAPGTPSSYVASAFDGLYVGGNVGYGFSKFDASASDTFGSVSSTQSASGFL